MKDIKICNVEGCNNKATRKGMCNTHYFRIYRNGDLETRKKGTGLQGKKCNIEGCEERHFAKGYCNKHYKRFVRQGDAKTVKTDMNNRNTFKTNNAETVKQLLNEGKTVEEISRIMGLSISRIYQLCPS